MDHERRLRLYNAKRKLTLDVFFDVLDLDHRLNLIPFLNQDGTVFAETALLLLDLQTIEMNDMRPGETCALLLEHDLSMESEAGKISGSWVAEFCLKDKDLAETVIKNLAHVASYASMALALPEQAIVAERVQRLTKSINTGRLMVASRSRGGLR